MSRASRRSTQKLVREGDYVAEVSIELLEEDGPWTPYLSIEDAYRLDELREALRDGDVARATRLADPVYSWSRWMASRWR